MRLSQSGQAMTEFVVSVSFVFLAIFVFVPSFGKIMDLQFQNMMASRYVVWERTVWFDQKDDNNRDDFEISTETFESVALRDDDEIMASTENRFFYKHGQVLPNFLSEADVDAPDGNVGVLWNYVQSGESMYGGTTLENFDADETPGIAYDVLTTLAGVIQAVVGPINEFLSFLGNDNDDRFTFPLMVSDDGPNKTYYNPTIITQLNIGNAHGEGDSVWDRVDGTKTFSPGIESAFFQNWDGKLEARAAILADGWNVQSEEHYVERVDDYVPSDLFDFEVFNLVIDFASLLEGGPDPTPLSSGSAIAKLGFGAVEVNPMPSDEDGVPLPVECNVGVCTFAE